MNEDLREKLEKVTGKNLEELEKLNRNDPAKASEALSKLTKSYSDYCKAEWNAYEEEEKRAMDEEKLRKEEERWKTEAELKREELRLKEEELKLKQKQQEIDQKKWRSISFDTGAKLIATLLLTAGAAMFSQNGGLLPRSVSDKLPKIKI